MGGAAAGEAAGVVARGGGAYDSGLLGVGGSMATGPRGGPGDQAKNSTSFKAQLVDAATNATPSPSPAHLVAVVAAAAARPCNNTTGNRVVGVQPLGRVLS